MPNTTPAVKSEAVQMRCTNLMVMGKDKLKRFAEIKTFDNVIHPIIEYQDISHPLKGKWHEEFKSKKPIILELGCGRGEYTV